MNNFVKSSVLSLGFFIASRSYAHSFDDFILPPEGLHAELSVSGAYRSDALIEGNQRWVVPGTLMGGEAYPSEAGFGLDELFLTPVYRKENTYVMLKIGRHLGSEDLELEHVLLGYKLNNYLALEGGKMAAIFTPYNGEHPSDTCFSSRRLVYDALWGGQFNDTGLRLKSNIGGLDSGLELWKGSRFPAKEKDTEKSAYDVYTRYSVEDENHSLSVGAYYFRADANARDDSRYSATHSHAPAAVTVDPTYFDGKVETKGLMGSLSTKFRGDWSAGFLGEITQIQQNGRLRDATHQADFENQTMGLWGELFAAVQREKFSFRAERLKVKSDVYGAAAGVLADKLKLQAMGEDPYRNTLSYEHEFDATFRARVEWAKDFTTLVKRDIYTVSGVWTETVFGIGH